MWHETGKRVDEVCVGCGVVDEIGHEDQVDVTMVNKKKTDE
jgi:ABC-type tungstate transport system permease subunit